MLKFIKKIFQNERQEVKEAMEIRLDSLEEWLNEKSKPLLEDVRQHTEEILMKSDEELQRTRFNIEVLENAKLQNPNIPFKAKQYMEGNRKAYIRAINSFLGHMEINNRDYFYLLDFCSMFDKLINDLNKGTFRSYQILQEFFANETNKIALNLRNFDIIFKELKSVLNNEKVTAVNDLKEDIKSLKIKIKQKINLDVDLKNMEAGLALANGEKDALMADIESFGRSDAHNNFLNLSEEKKNKAAAFYNDESQILQSFSVLERPLRKYSHIAFEHEELILDYLKQPIETLANDKNMAILDILNNLEKVLTEDRLQVDDRKKEKSLEEVKKMNREFITLFLKKYHSFKADMEELEKKIKLTGVAEKLREFNRQLEDTNLRIEKVNVEFNKLKNDSERLNEALSSLTVNIGNYIKKIFGEEVRIVS